MRNEDGFTLIEALVALVVLAVSGIALLGAAETHVQRIAGLENRAVAQWVAENRMADLAIAGGAESATLNVAMLGDDWAVEQVVTETDDPDLASVELRVSRSDDPAILSRFTGFIDTGAGR